MTGGPTDRPDDRSREPDEDRPAADDPLRSTDGAGASWRDSDPTPGRDFDHDRMPGERPSAGATASVVRLLKAGGRIAADALILGLWVIFLTLLFLETNWPRWAFYGLLLGGVAIYVFATVPWLGTRD